MPESRTLGHLSLTWRQRVEGGPHRVKRNVEDSGGAFQASPLLDTVALLFAHVTRPPSYLGTRETGGG